jgi:hypothetical protein
VSGDDARDVNTPDDCRKEEMPDGNPLREPVSENGQQADEFEPQDAATWSIELGNPPSESPLPPLRQRALHGISWNFAAGFGNQAIHFVIGILIARTLSPQDFGLMGMIAIFVTLTRTLADGGFGAALIQKRSSDDVDASSVFYLNLLASTVLAAILWDWPVPSLSFIVSPSWSR